MAMKWLARKRRMERVKIAKIKGEVIAMLHGSYESRQKDRAFKAWRKNWGSVKIQSCVRMSIQRRKYLKNKAILDKVRNKFLKATRGLVVMVFFGWRRFVKISRKEKREATLSLQNFCRLILAKNEAKRRIKFEIELEKKCKRADLVFKINAKKRVLRHIKRVSDCSRRIVLLQAIVRGVIMRIKIRNGIRFKEGVRAGSMKCERILRMGLFSRSISHINQIMKEESSIQILQNFFRTLRSKIKVRRRRMEKRKEAEVMRYLMGVVVLSRCQFSFQHIQKHVIELKMGKRMIKWWRRVMVAHRIHIFVETLKKVSFDIASQSIQESAYHLSYKTIVAKMLEKLRIIHVLQPRKEEKMRIVDERGEIVKVKNQRNQLFFRFGEWKKMMIIHTRASTILQKRWRGAFTRKNKELIQQICINQKENLLRIIEKKRMKRKKDSIEVMKYFFIQSTIQAIQSFSIPSNFTQFFNNMKDINPESGIISNGIQMEDQDEEFGSLYQFDIQSPSFDKKRMKLDTPIGLSLLFLQTMQKVEKSGFLVVNDDLMLNLSKGERIRLFGVGKVIALSSSSLQLMEDMIGEFEDGYRGQSLILMNGFISYTSLLSLLSTCCVERRMPLSLHLIHVRLERRSLLLICSLLKSNHFPKIISSLTLEKLDSQYTIPLILCSSNGESKVTMMCCDFGGYERRLLLQEQLDNSSISTCSCHPIGTN